MPPTLAPLRDRLAGPAPALPAWLDRAADGWVAAPPRLRWLLAGTALAGLVLLALVTREPTVAVVVAARDLAPGTVVSLDDLTVASLRGSSVPPDAARSRDEVAGRLLRHPVAARQPVLARLLVTGPETALAEGRAAVAVPTDLLPRLAVGQRVDLLGADAAGTAHTLATGATVIASDDDTVWLDVARGEAAAVGHAVAWGGITVALLPPAAPP